VAIVMSNFMETFHNPDWTFIINFFSIALAILPLLLGIKLFEKKELGLIYWHNYTRHEKIEDRDDLVRQVHDIKLVFENHGKEVIYERDLVNRISIKVENADKINLVNIEANCPYNKVYMEQGGTTIQFGFDFLEPKKYLKIYIEYFASSRSKAHVSGKIIGGNEIKSQIDIINDFAGYYKGKREVETQMFYFPFISIVLVSVMSQIFLHMFNLKLDTAIAKIQELKKESFILIFVALFLVFISIIIANKMKKAFIPFATFAEKEKNWFKKTTFNCT
jgi:hypothetical protein